MVLAELQIGWLRSHTEPYRQIQRFGGFAPAMLFLPILRSTVSVYIEIRRELERVNVIIPENDLWTTANCKRARHSFVDD